MASALLKVVFVGDSGVGKSSIYQRLEHNAFFPLKAPTIGGSFTRLDVPTVNGTAAIALWDTAGQERFRTIVPLYFQRVALVLIVFAIDARDSFENIALWHEMAKAHAPPSVRFFLIGNKSDLGTRAIAFDVGQKRCAQLGMDVYIETSAATGAGCDDLLAAFGDFAARFHADAQGAGAPDAGKAPVAAEDSPNVCC
jgi:small GTP-binding protein